MWSFVPLALLFAALSALRRFAYRRGWLTAARLPVPVIVIGNLSVGGTGKTPLTLWLAERLRAAGWRPGIVSRGYGGRAQVAEVTVDSDPDQVGDEPVLLARRAACPVWVGRRRAEAARALLAHHPEVDVLLSDDGLQHYALARDCEIAVIDARRAFGNGWSLPAGPLREPIARLFSVDAVVCHGDNLALPAGAPPCYRMRLIGGEPYSLAMPHRRRPIAEFRGRRVWALAGIGDPERFFAHLRAQGLMIDIRAYPDHHRFTPADLPAGTVLMTEKDAVKCARFASADCWVYPVSAEVEPELMQRVLNKIGHAHGPQTA